MAGEYKILEVIRLYKVRRNKIVKCQRRLDVVKGEKRPGSKRPETARL